MSAPSAFRIAEDEFRTWTSAVGERAPALRGLPAVAKEMEAHLAKVGPDGHVLVSRHQLFTWAESLHGATLRDPRAASAGSQLSLAQVVDDMRAVLAGRAAGAPTPPRPPAPAAPPAAMTPPPAGATVYAPPPPIVYGAPAQGSAAGGGLVTAERIAAAVRDTLRGARQEVCVVAPWDAGVDTLVNDLGALPREVRVLVVSRRPQQETPEFHRLLGLLGARRAVTAFSPHLQTRMLLVDDTHLLLGAAAAFPPTFPTREAAIATRDPALVRAAKEHFERVFAEAGGRRP